MNIRKADEVAVEQRCMFGTEKHHCGAPAVRHILMLDGNRTMDCAEHVKWWDAHGYTDAHDIVSVCGFPGSTWIESGDEGNGLCIIEGLDVGSVLLAEAPLEVSA